MKLAKPSSTFARPASGEKTGNGPDVGCIELTKVIRDFVPLVAETNGKSFGALIDDAMKDVALSGGEIQDITLHITKEYWGEFALATMRSKFPDYGLEA